MPTRSRTETLVRAIYECRLVLRRLGGGRVSGGPSFHLRRLIVAERSLLARRARACLRASAPRVRPWPIATARSGLGSGYKAGQTSGQDVGGWMPPQQSADSGWLWSRDLAVARTRELLQNEPWAQ
ncbi:hypothetical protein CSW58_13120, partial [Caulobacter sp. B11]|uniref:hypothetical protein n=1 Tax=Caulobacter sp. B11 TaxID=2048899 RepID=UPI000C1329DC